MRPTAVRMYPATHTSRRSHRRSGSWIACPRRPRRRAETRRIYARRIAGFERRSRKRWIGDFEIRHSQPSDRCRPCPGRPRPSHRYARPSTRPHSPRRRRSAPSLSTAATAAAKDRGSSRIRMFSPSTAASPSQPMEVLTTGLPHRPGIEDLQIACRRPPEAARCGTPRRASTASRPRRSRSLRRHTVHGSVAARPSTPGRSSAQAHRPPPARR